MRVKPSARTQNAAPHCGSFCHPAPRILTLRVLLQEVRELELEPRSCDRVAQVARLRHVGSGRIVVVLNTHLTVAHVNGHDIPHCRPQQMEQVLAAAAAGGKDDVVVVCADS